MVKRQLHYQDESTGFIEPEAWLAHIGEKRKNHEIKLIEQAFSLAQLSGLQHATLTGESCLQQGLAIADILDQLDLDVETISAALIFPSVQYADLSLDDVEEQLTIKIARLVEGVSHMDAIRTLHSQAAQISHHKSQLDNLRKMLLAMVEDVRVVLIKLAERTFIMRAAKVLNTHKQKEIAQEINDIYAPLANRLGIGQLKWELEDLAFRYLESEIYKTIAKSVDQKRTDRENYIKEVIAEIKTALSKVAIHDFKINGRAKHIYSIYRKMHRKGVSFDKIYDVSAVRILVPSIENCYAALGIVHSLWPPITDEFDDYIAHPKPNGYRSLHTAVIGPQERNVEVQIRTYEMHQESELGVAAHWIYKEGGTSPSSYDQKIAWLRQILEWQKELSDSDSELGRLEAKIFEDRVYVFTPNSEIIDLPIGSTPLDFAYCIHTQIGHRCRGAKIDGHIVPLTYELKTGDRVEILTAKHPNPSRDWLNPNLHYLKTSRAKAKIHHWFKEQDYEKNRHDGHEIVMRELRRLNVDNIKVDDLANKFSQKSADDFLSAIGAGDIRIGQLLHVIEVLEQDQKEVAYTDETETGFTPIKKSIQTYTPSGITIEGVGNLLTNIAKCCYPLPGDPIIGYITQGKGVSIHRQDCLNILSITQRHKERLIDVHWGEQTTQYPVDVYIKAYDRHGLARDITTLLANERINIVMLSSATDKKEHTANINLTVEVTSLNALSRVFDKIMQITNVISIERMK